MLLFIFITTFILSFSKSEDPQKSKLTLYDSEIENLKGYHTASKQVTSQNFRNLIEFECKNDYVDCSQHGVCSDDKSDCKCDPGFTTFPKESLNKCNYEKKKQMAAFLYEFFLGFGAGHFYCERYLNASLKLSAFLFGVLIICLLPLSAKFINDKFDSDCLVLTTSCFYYFCAMGLAFWFIYDLVIFGMNKYLDGNGVPLAHWGT
jgi:TM2 domain-containing membrane protein YozV